MALTDEQRSLLQLLLEGGQGYDDIGSLLGMAPDEVRSRARAALTEIGGADPDAQVGLSDFLLGKADPIGRADAVRHLQNDPEANALAARLLTQLRLLAPQAELPEIPAPKGGRAASRPPPEAQRPGHPASASRPPAGSPARCAARAPRSGGTRWSRSASRRAAGAGRGARDRGRLRRRRRRWRGRGDRDHRDRGDTEDLTIVHLTPLDGDSGASGQAVFAQAQDQPLLQINLTGLEPAGQDQNYIVWLYNSDRVAFPLARDQVGENGNLTGAAAIPQEILPLLAQFGCVDVSLASNAETQEALQQAVEGQTLPAPQRRDRAARPDPDAARREAPTGADSQCGGAGAGGGAAAGRRNGGAVGLRAAACPGS